MGHLWWYRLHFGVEEEHFRAVLIPEQVGSLMSKQVQKSFVVRLVLVSCSDLPLKSIVSSLIQTGHRPRTKSAGKQAMIRCMAAQQHVFTGDASGHDQL